MDVSAARWLHQPSRYPHYSPTSTFHSRIPIPSPLVQRDTPITMRISLGPADTWPGRLSRETFRVVFKELIVERFRTLIWPRIAFRVLRQYILDDGPAKVFTLFSGDQPVHGDGPEWMDDEPEAAISDFQTRKDSYTNLCLRVSIPVSPPVYSVPTENRGPRPERNV
ncbi:hypothetical protein EDD85DRAFT_946328 [Armillaria nabsnona]|nr:hypothetical protein EDD85DRAFT_946328 [Armillaria nabsnona]